MKILIVSEQQTDQWQNRLSRELGMEVSVLRYCQGEHRDWVGEVKARHPDLLLTADLPGFEQCTLTDNISYNLLDCKQIHLLLHENLPNEPYLGRQLSLAMFFYCAGDGYYEYLARKYPGLPYLKKLPDWREGADVQTQTRNAETLGHVLREVLRECHM